MMIVFLLLLLVIRPSTVDGFYFNIPATQRVCFYEELTYETIPVFIHYNVPQLPPTANVSFVVTDPIGAQKASEFSRKSEDTISFVAEGVVGAYIICASIPGADITLRMFLEIDTAKPEADEGVAGKTLLEGYESKIRSLRAQLNAVALEADYFEGRHVRFEETSESTYSRLVWWGLVHLGLLFGAAAWQVLHLKNFFRQKKLV